MWSPENQPKCKHFKTDQTMWTIFKLMLYLTIMFTYAQRVVPKFIYSEVHFRVTKRKIGQKSTKSFGLAVFKPSDSLPAMRYAYNYNLCIKYKRSLLKYKWPISCVCVKYSKLNDPQSVLRVRIGANFTLRVFKSLWEQLQSHIASQRNSQESANKIISWH